MVNKTKNEGLSHSGYERYEPIWTMNGITVFQTLHEDTSYICQSLQHKPPLTACLCFIAAGMQLLPRAHWNNELCLLHLYTPFLESHLGTLPPDIQWHFHYMLAGHRPFPSPGVSTAKGDLTVSIIRFQSLAAIKSRFVWWKGWGPAV